VAFANLRHWEVRVNATRTAPKITENKCHQGEHQQQQHGKKKDDLGLRGIERGTVATTDVNLGGRTMGFASVRPVQKVQKSGQGEGSGTRGWVDVRRHTSPKNDRNEPGRREDAAGVGKS